MQLYDSNKKNFQRFLKSKIIKESVDYCCCEKIVSKGSFILRRQQVVYKHHENFRLA